MTNAQTQPRPDRPITVPIFSCMRCRHGKTLQGRRKRPIGWVCRDCVACEPRVDISKSSGTLSR